MSRIDDAIDARVKLVLQLDGACGEFQATGAEGAAVGEVAAANGLIGERASKSLPHAAFAPILTRHEKRLILPDRACHLKAKNVLPERRFFAAVEEIASVEYIVAKVFVSRAVERIATGLRFHHYIGASG